MRRTRRQRRRPRLGVSLSSPSSSLIQSLLQDLNTDSGHAVTGIGFENLLPVVDRRLVVSALLGLQSLGSEEDALDVSGAPGNVLRLLAEIRLCDPVRI